MKIRNLLLTHALLALLLMLVCSVPVSGQTVTTFTSNDTWVVPLGVTSVKIEAWGGGGGGAVGGLGNSSGNGGGGGAYNTQTFPVSAGETYFITVGTGGSGNATDKDGKTSSFTGPYGTLTANGGIGGTLVFGAGNGGTGTYNGGKGGSSGSGYSGAGGGGAGNAGSGTNGGTTTAGAGGTGDPNEAPYKGGSGGVGRNTSGVGNPGNIPGGGGAGGKGTTTGTRAGGNGARGQVVITFSYDQCYDGTLTLKQGSGNVSQTVEQYYPVTDIAFDLGGNATGVTVTGLPTGVTGSLNQGVYTISGTPLESGTFNYTLNTTGTPSPCQEDEISGTLTVNPEPYNPLAGRAVFNTSGTWQVPLNVSSITLKAWGGGGGGGAASNGAGGGGGGGAYSEATIQVTAGEIYTITVGGGGSGGVYTIGSPGDANGDAGNPSVVINPSNSTVLTAAGGAGGGGGLGTLSGLEIIQNNGTGGLGGTGTYNGGTGGTANNTSGSGGGGAGSAGIGGNGSTSGPGIGGQGSPNIAPFIGGNGGSQRSNNGTGNAGGLPGAGGSGARAWNYGPGYSGGAGSKGQVVINFVFDACNDGTLTLTSEAGTDNQSICRNIPVETIKYTLGGFATGAQAEDLPDGLVTVFNAGIFTISGTPTETGTFDYSVSTTGVPDPCQNATVYGTININPQPGNSGEVKVEFNTGNTWKVPDGVEKITVEAWGSGGSGGGVELSVFGIGGGGGGGAYALKNDISVTPLDILNIVVAEASTGNPAGDGNDGSHSTITGLENIIYAAGGKGGKKSASIFTSGSADGGEGGNAADCEGDCYVSGSNGTDGYRFELLVEPADDAGQGGKGATINGGEGGAPIGDFIGDGNPGTAPGGGGSGSRSGLTTSFNTIGGSGGAGKVIIYFVCPEVTNGGEIKEDQTICINTAPGKILNKTLASGETRTIDYQWQKSEVSENEGFQDIENASDTVYSPGVLTVTTWYKRLAKSFCDEDWTTAVESNVIRITVEETPQTGSLSEVPDAGLICQGDDVSATLTPGSGGNGTDSLSYRIHDGTNWSAWQSYTSGTDISTDNATQIEIQTLRLADGCNFSKADTIRWEADITPPDVTEKTNVSVYLDPTGNYTFLADDLLEAYSDAGVGIKSVSIEPKAVTCVDLGSKNIEVTVADYCDNETVVNMTITVAEGTGLGDWEYCNTQASASGTSTYSPCTNNGTFYLTSKGKSTATSDVMHFVYQEIGTTGTIIARLADVKNDGWAGVMMRESCDPGSKTVLFKTRLYNPNVLTGYRKLTDKTIYTVSQVYQQIRWMKIQRNGNTFLVYVSYNGTTWTKAYTTTITMNSTIMAGIFTENNLTGRTTQAWFDHVELAPILKTGSEPIENGRTSIAESMDIYLYPNPTSQEITLTLLGIDFPENGFAGYSANLISSDGKVIKQFNLQASETLLNLDGIKPGVYMVRVEDKEFVLTKRLVIQ